MLLLNECNSVLVIGNHFGVRRKAMIWVLSRIGSDYWVSWRWPRSFVWAFGKLNDGSSGSTWHLAQLKNQKIYSKCLTYLDILNMTFFTNFWSIKIDLSGNAIWKSAKMSHLNISMLPILFFLELTCLVALFDCSYSLSKTR